MLIINKIDLGMQAAILGGSIACLASAPAYTLAGEVILGVWQLGSALANYRLMSKDVFRKKINLYWILTFSALFLLALTGISWYIGAFAVLASWGIAIYYWITYKSFIQYLSYRKELSTLVRNRKNYAL
jgi:hypothetical protein